MSGLKSRRKGRAGQTTFAAMLRDRDWGIIETSAGQKVEDIVATCPDGTTYSVEVKKRRVIDMLAFRTQAMTQAAARKLPWMVAAHVEGSSSWLVWRKGEPPVVWSEK